VSVSQRRLGSTGIVFLMILKPSSVSPPYAGCRKTCVTRVPGGPALAIAARDEAASILVMGGRRGSHVVAANTFDAMFLVGGYFARNREPAIEGKLSD
jgi:hypothetical protein